MISISPVYLSAGETWKNVKSHIAGGRLELNVSVKLTDYIVFYCEKRLYMISNYLSQPCQQVHINDTVTVSMTGQDRR